jgi:hypothetical protein
MLYQWVGTGRTAELCLPIPPVATVRAAFTAHGDPMKGFPAFRAPLTLARIPKPLHSAGLLLAHLSRCGPSPGTWLSHALTTMATLTAAWGIGGFGITFVLPSLALLSIPMSLSHVHRHGLKRDHVGGSYLPTSTCYCRLLSGPGVDQVRPCHSFAALRGLTASRWKEHPLCSFPHTDCPIRQAETGVDFPVGCNLLRLDSPLISQPSTASWRLASRLTAPFKGMLLTGLERPIPLSPNGSWAP